MKRYIVSIITCILLGLCLCPVYAVGSVEIKLTSIDGCQNCVLEDQTSTISLDPSGQYEFTNISVGDNVDSWFSDLYTNIGTNLTATIEEVNTETLKVKFEGTAPSIAGTYDLIASIPDGHVNILGGAPVSGDITVSASNEGKFIVHDYSQFVIKYINSESGIVGEVGTPITPQSVFIQIEDSTIDLDDSDDFAATISSYTFDTVNGLTPSVKSYDEIDTIEVEFTGTPLSASHEQIALTIPAQMMQNKYCAISVCDPSVMFNIVDNTKPIIPTPQVIYEPPHTGVN